MGPRIFPITMPKWGIEMQQGTITRWHAAAGTAVEKGAPLLDVETDKIVNSVEAPVSGVLRLVIANEGSTENVGALIAVFADPTVADDEVERFAQTFKPANASFEPEDFAPSKPPVSSTAPNVPAEPARSPAAAAPAAGAAVQAAAAAATAEAEGGMRVSPIARRIADRLGVDVGKVTGTGRNGRVSKEDVETYAAAMVRDGAASTAPSGPRRTKLTPMRAAIARRLTEAKLTIPHYRVSIDADFSALLARRARLKAEAAAVAAASGHATPSVNDFLVRAAALALLRHPLLNSHLVGDEIQTFAHADICVAVSTDGGLMAPIVREADLKSVDTIGAEIRALVRRARAGNLTRDDIAGGTFTISNLGMFGIDRFDAIINPPQVAILAVGAIIERVVARMGSPAVVPAATLSLSADHRVIDGAAAAEFLATLRTLIEDAGALS
jgi:pyruvate dehydrogenase E2 component (dihydrolipoamide acetyltransferase)